jgi:hypothetical protein
MKSILDSLEDRRANARLGGGQARIDEKMTQIKRGKPTDDKGEPTQTDGGYVPQGRTVIQENYTP